MNPMKAFFQFDSDIQQVRFVESFNDFHCLYNLLVMLWDISSDYF